jgi:RNA polymerase sigma factor (sigma-70 family)
MGEMARGDRRGLELRRAGRLESDSLERLYDEHAEALLAYLLRRTGSAEEAAELLAEVFASALASRLRARVNSSPRAWLFGIANHKVADFFRRGYVEDRARRRIGMAAVAFTDEELERAEQLIDLARGPTLLGLVGDLPEDQRDAVLARVVEERSYAAIAAAQGCSEQAARQRVSRGLSRLASWAKAAWS